MKDALQRFTIVSIPECDLTDKRVMVYLPPVRSHSGINTLTAMIAVRRRSSSYAELFKNLLFSKLCIHKQCSQCSCSCVETLMILRAKLPVVSSLLSSENSDFDASIGVSLPEK